MNAERMHAVAKRLYADLSSTEVPGGFAALLEQMNGSISNPQDPNLQSQVASTRTRLVEALGASAVNEFSPVERQVLQEWGVEDILGNQLAAEIDRVFAENQITMQGAMVQLQPLRDRLIQLNDNVAALVALLPQFNVAAEDLVTGEFEVDVLVPRSAVRNELGSLGEEFQNVQGILLPFVELTTGSRPPIEIRSIGSSDFTLFLFALPPAAACFAKGVDLVLSIYERLLNIRVLKSQIEELDLPGAEEAISESVLPLTAYADSAMDRELPEIARQLVEEFGHDSGLPEGRAPELEIEIRHSLKAVAGRIDKGYNISVRTGPLPEPPEEGEARAEEEVQLSRYAQEVLDRTQKLQFMNLSGNPILGSGEAAPSDESPSPESQSG